MRSRRRSTPNGTRRRPRTCYLLFGPPLLPGGGPTHAVLDSSPRQFLTQTDSLGLAGSRFFVGGVFASRPGTPTGGRGDLSADVQKRHNSSLVAARALVA